VVIVSIGDVAACLYIVFLAGSARNTIYTHRYNMLPHHRLTQLSLF